MVACKHFDKTKQEEATPSSNTCEECAKEGTKPVALRMCMTCGNVGCCDSSVGMHATKHFEDTGHPVMKSMPLQENSWKWCYLDKDYVED